MTLNGAIKQLHELQSAEDMPFYYKPAIAEVINVLLMDTQEVRHGHWVVDEDGNSKCSVCGTLIKQSFAFNGKYHFDNYCKNCGASMDEARVYERIEEEPEINPCRGCEDYDGKGGCLSHGGCGEGREDE